MSNDKIAGVTSNLTVKPPTYIEQKPYVNDTGVYVPLEPYVEEGCSGVYKCLITKEMFVEAYNKWIKNE